METVTLLGRAIPIGLGNKCPACRGSGEREGNLVISFILGAIVRPVVKVCKKCKGTGAAP